MLDERPTHMALEQLQDVAATIGISSLVAESPLPILRRDLFVADRDDGTVFCDTDHLTRR